MTVVIFRAVENSPSVKTLMVIHGCFEFLNAGIHSNSQLFSEEGKSGSTRFVFAKTWKLHIEYLKQTMIGNFSHKKKTWSSQIITSNGIVSKFRTNYGAWLHPSKIGPKNAISFCDVEFPQPYNEANVSLFSELYNNI